jgi:amidophosphoribosyltransferase
MAEDDMNAEHQIWSGSFGASEDDKFGDDRLREVCGVFGILGHDDAAAITALGLHALQHRGQEAAGIVSFDGKYFHSERRLGLVGDNFSKRSVIEGLPRRQAVGHTRY